jgi:hypothetical protein
MVRRPLAHPDVLRLDLLPLTASDKLFFRDGEVAILDVNDNTRHINGVLIALEIVVKG